MLTLKTTTAAFLLLGTATASVAGTYLVVTQTVHCAAPEPSKRHLRIESVPTRDGKSY